MSEDGLDWKIEDYLAVEFIDLTSDKIRVGEITVMMPKHKISMKIPENMFE